MADWVASFARVHHPAADGWARITGRAIYVLPTKYGLLFLLLVLAVLVGAINYANNPAFLLAFVLTGVGLATLIQTWRNLQGLAVSWIGEAPAFAGDPVGFRFRLSSERQTDRPALQLQLAAGEASALDLPSGGRASVLLTCPAPRRGRLTAGRLILSTRYPLGLVRAWCYLETEAWSPVYPRPAEGATPWQDSDGHQDALGDQPGADDFIGLRDYHPGDPLRRLDWKAFAAERGLLTKQFGSGGSEPVWLEWAHWPYLATEARLSRLCREVLEAHHMGRPFGLRMPALQIEPALGEAHKRACLSALALYGAGA